MIMGQLCVLFAWLILDSHPKNVQNENETASKRLILVILNGASALHEICFILPLWFSDLMMTGALAFLQSVKKTHTHTHTQNDAQICAPYRLHKVCFYLFAYIILCRSYTFWSRASLLRCVKSASKQLLLSLINKSHVQIYTEQQQRGKKTKLIFGWCIKRSAYIYKCILCVRTVE